MEKIDGTHNTNRRFVNDAVRKFIHLIDLDSENISGHFFTCRKCEVPMADSEFSQLGLAPLQNAGKKRLHSVVIDAKVIALLNDTDEVVDRHDNPTVVTGLNVRNVKNRLTQNALKLFLKTVRNTISKIRNHIGASGTANGNEIASHCLQDGHLLVRLRKMKDHGSNKSQSDRVKVMKYISIIRWYMDNNG